MTLLYHEPIPLNKFAAFPTISRAFSLVLLGQLDQVGQETIAKKCQNKGKDVKYEFADRFIDSF